MDYAAQLVIAMLGVPTILERLNSLSRKSFIRIKLFGVNERRPIGLSLTEIVLEDSNYLNPHAQSRYLLSFCLLIATGRQNLHSTSFATLLASKRVRLAFVQSVATSRQDPATIF